MQLRVDMVGGLKVRKFYACDLRVGCRELFEDEWIKQ